MPTRISIAPWDGQYPVVKESPKAIDDLTKLAIRQNAALITLTRMNDKQILIRHADIKAAFEIDAE